MVTMSSPPGPVATGRPAIVVPCYNEASRLVAEDFLALSEHADVWLVDDGSSDSTREVLDRLSARSNGRIRADSNPCNLGKAETVRRHMLAAVDAGAPAVGFLDADLATPVSGMLELMAILDSTGAQAVTAARVALSGRDIRRSAARHYVGRVFSTVASLALGTAYYDTQCGAKVFRATPQLRAALAEPFLSRWAFDVELLGRLLAGDRATVAVPPGQLLEYPLRSWQDVGGSKLTPTAAWTAFTQLFVIWRDLARRRRR